jgi:hypothetical protein
MALAALGDGLLAGSADARYVVPVRAALGEQTIGRALRARGFDPTPYHVDVARDLFRPRYERAFLLPLNPRIPRGSFEAVVRDLESLIRAHSEARPTAL